MGISLPKVKVKTPKITVGKDLGAKNIGTNIKGHINTTFVKPTEFGLDVAKKASAPIMGLAQKNPQLAAVGGTALGLPPGLTAGIFNPSNDLQNFQSRKAEFPAPVNTSANYNPVPLSNNKFIIIIGAVAAAITIIFALRR